MEEERGRLKGEERSRPQGPVTSAASGAVGREGEGDDEARAGAKPDLGGGVSFIDCDLWNIQMIT